MNREQILEYLSTVSNSHVAVNVAMHLVVAVALVAVVAAGLTTVRRTIVSGVLLALPVTVVVTAVLHGNPFHLVTFGLVSAVTGYEVFAGHRNTFERPGLSPNTAISTVLILTGLWYPEFVDASPAAMTLLSPVGRVPCPTLLVMLGLLGLAYPLVNRLQYAVVAAVGLVFGLIGTVILGVYLDAALILAALHGLWNTYRSRHRVPATGHVTGDPVSAR